MSEVAERPATRRDRPPGTRWSTIVLRWRRFAGRIRFGPIVVAVGIALIVGLIVGRASAPGAASDAAQAIDSSLLPLALDADGIWTSASDDRDPVAEAFVALRRDGDASMVDDSHDEWLRAYDAVLVQLAGLDMPPTARPVQRQFIAAVTMSRDAVELLGHAAGVDDELTRRDLLTEVGRLRQRGEQLTQSARASMLDLDGQRADVSPMGPLPSFLEGRS